MSKDNTGNWNTGNWNTGNWNTGYWNIGNWNTGNWNTGYRNTGYRNTGNRNTGNLNTGNLNTGNRNTGNRNTGDWNTGDWNTGSFNTDEPKMRCFNRDSQFTKTEYEEKYGWVYPDLHIAQWVYGKDMTDKEKEANPHWETTDGYLRTMGYKEAWAEYWQRASESDKQWFQNLPNFDGDIFFEITGIDVRAVNNATAEAIALLEKNGYKIVKE